ncbi:MAG: hypothetical protein HQ564_05405 [Candidatus Saganbacteria bacterium]|nr:hypothetical protein [Candidatus Saganbacteria bacterium]
MKKKPISKTNYSFKIERKRLLEFSKMPIAARLKWLEEALRFAASINKGKTLRNWLKLRNT